MPQAKLFHLMVVTLLEQGGPMALEAIVERLNAAGITAATGDLATSLLKSWHGLNPVYRDHGGRFGLEVTAWELESLIFRLGLRPATQAGINWQPEVERVSDEVPLTEEEVRAAFARATFGNPSNARRIAAALDVHGQRMNAVDFEACLRHGVQRGFESTWPIFVAGQDRA